MLFVSMLTLNGFPITALQAFGNQFSYLTNENMSSDTSNTSTWVTSWQTEAASSSAVSGQSFTTKLQHLQYLQNA